VTSSGEIHCGDTAESCADGGAERSPVCGSRQDRRPSVVEVSRKAASGRRLSGGWGWRGDDHGAFGEVCAARPAFGGCERHRAPVGLQERFGRGGLTKGGAEAAGEAAESIGELGGEGGDVVESHGPVVAGECEQVADGGRDGGEGRDAGIDEGPEDAGSEGFAGARRALEDEDGVRTRRAEGGPACGSRQEPGEAAKPGSAGGEVKAGAENVQGGRRVRGWRSRFGDR
jgi:hypothetical protein